MNSANETNEAHNFASLRQTMVDCQLRTFDVTDHQVLAAMAAVPREAFLPASLLPLAYSDSAIGIEAGGVRRRLLQPMVLARLVQAAGIKAGEKVLCVGGGSGYGAAVVSHLAGEVVALEESSDFAAMAQSGFQQAGVGNATAKTGNLSAGAAAAAPFDVILLEGASEVEPSALLDQLSATGCLVMIDKPVSGPHAGACRAVCYRKQSGVMGCTVLFNCAADVLPGFEAAREFSF